MYKSGNKTLVEAGQPLKVTWHLGYPHRGGVQIELLDSQDKQLLLLSGAQDEYLGSKFVSSTLQLYMFFHYYYCIRIYNT